MERQNHGFIFEDYIINKYNLIKEIKYTGTYDAYTKDGIPVQIKLEKYNSDIEMADIFRNSQVNSDFILIVGFWSENKNNIIEQRTVYFKKEDYLSFFNQELLKEFESFLKGITNDYSDDIKWKKQITLFKEEWQLKTPNFIRPRFKRDHKKQKRIQCAINNKDFHNYVKQVGEYTWE